MAATKSISGPDFSTLPTCLLTIIAEFLPSRVDTLCFRAVCRSFRSSATPSRKPWIPYPNLHVPAAIVSGPEPEFDSESFSDCGSFSEPDEPSRLTLRQSVFYAFEPLTEVEDDTEMWIIRVEELGSNRVSFKKPFSGVDYRKKSLESLNLLDYRVKVMGRVYKLDFEPENDYCDFEEVESRKVVASDDGSSGMALLYNDKLVVWRNGDDDWIHIDDVYNSVDEDTLCADIIYHKGKFYAFYRKDDSTTIDPNPRSVLVTVDAKSMVVTEETWYQDPPFGPFGHSKYLVKSSNDLFLLIKYFESFDFASDGNICVDPRAFRFSISKFDEERNEFVAAQNAFKNKVVFVGEDFAFTVSAEDFPRLKRNCIYLNDDAFRNHYEDFDFYDVDLFSNEDYDNGFMPGLNVGVYDLEKHTSELLLAFSDPVFWPPPSWLEPSSGSSRG